MCSTGVPGPSSGADFQFPSQFVQLFDLVLWWLRWCCRGGGRGGGDFTDSRAVGRWVLGPSLGVGCVARSEGVHLHLQRATAKREEGAASGNRRGTPARPRSLLLAHLAAQHCVSHLAANDVQRVRAPTTAAPAPPTTKKPAAPSAAATSTAAATGRWAPALAGRWWALRAPGHSATATALFRPCICRNRTHGQDDQAHVVLTRCNCLKRGGGGSNAVAVGTPG
jgi:hypothetical protein